MKSKKIQQALELAASSIAKADVLWIGAGAGMGVDSGLPDFRGDEGFWNEYPALREDGLSFADLANPTWFFHDPKRAWGFYGHRYMLYDDTVPHAGFDLLKQWCDRVENSFVFTSNVDGHFQKAGFEEEQIYEVHGSIRHFQRIDHTSAEIWQPEGVQLEIRRSDLTAHGELPRCPFSGKLARPNILMFGDSYWNSKRATQQAARYKAWLKQNGSKNIVAIELGAGTAIPTVRIGAERIASKVIRINPRESQGGSKVISLPIGALEALSEIEKLLKR